MKITTKHPSPSQLDEAQPLELSADLTNEPLTPSPLLEPFRDAYFGGGLLMLCISVGLFGLYELFGTATSGRSDDFAVFIVHYGLSVAFSIALLTNGYWRANRYPEHRPARWMGLLLWLVSAYALNRYFLVFQQSTTWLCWALVLIGVAMVGYAWKEQVSVRMQQMMYAILAMGCLLFTYMAIYVAPMCLISVPMLIGLGMSIHSFVPITFAIVLGRRIWFDAKQAEHLRLGIGVGLAAPIIAVILFLMSWISDRNQMEQVRMEAATRNTSDLPDWVLIAQQLKPNWITNRLLLAGHVYDEGHFFNDGGWGLDHLTAFDDVKQHDPLVVIASNLFPASDLPETERINLLKVLQNERYGTEEKFWTGRHLSTKDIVSQVRIWPEFRLSYTEKTMWIHNEASRSEEALFTFHLPAGSVVSSMSLWVNGHEEPARLTTVAKADSAYRQIVGVESRVFARDPSVVYWQEGNRITIRVFPCGASEDRRVKLGITSPLAFDHGQLVYKNPYFDGPNTSSANEFIQVDFTTPPNQLQSPWLFDPLKGNTLTHRGHYEPDWSLRFPAPAVSNESFELNGMAYQLGVYQSTQAAFTPTDVFLDLNSAWSQVEFDTVLRLVKQSNSRVWVFSDGLKQLTSQNANALYEQFSTQQFSLFPTYRITNPATALLITKGTPLSPTLSDLKNSPFANRMHGAARQEQPIRTFCIGNDLSPYLKTLAELHVLNVSSGSLNELSGLLTKHQFPTQLNDSDRVALPEAGVTIQESPVRVRTAEEIQKTGIVRQSSAPDHLARLFFYNHLLQRIGRNYFVPNYQTADLIEEAQRAHIVSPLSSLVVLETENDYNRFGIKKDTNGLDNATLKSEGAVPEPHEWALLAMVALLIGWLYWRKSHAIG
ncbi:hypothetical protein GCM10027341_23180 [Spirosoma knui]